MTPAPAQAPSRPLSHEAASHQVFQYHPVLGHRYIPGLRTRVPHWNGGYLVRVNEAGFRCDHEVTPERPAGSARVLLFGDSFTAGDGVSNRDRYGDALERLVPGLQVLNFGLSGSGTDQQYLAFREMAAGLDYDLVVVGVFVENIRRIVSRYRGYMTPAGELVYRAKPFFEIGADGTLTLRNVPVPREPVALDEIPAAERDHIADNEVRFRTARFAGRGAVELAQRVTRYQPLPAYRRSSSRPWRLMRAILAEWAREARSPVLVMPISLWRYVVETSSPRAYRRRFGELEGLPGLSVHDPLDDIHAVPRAEREGLRLIDYHPSPAMHGLLARSLAPPVRRMLGDR